MNTEQIIEAFNRLGRAAQLSGERLRSLPEIYRAGTHVYHLKIMKRDLCSIKISESHKPKGPAIRQRKDRHLRK